MIESQSEKCLALFLLASMLEVAWQRWRTHISWIIISLWQRFCVGDCMKLADFQLAFNSLAPGRFWWNSSNNIFNPISMIDGWGISCEIALRWMSLDLTDDMSTLIQVMAWCHQATSHYLSQCWPRYMSPYGITRPQWVDSIAHGFFGTMLFNGMYILGDVYSV